jgi:hypothetical protein
MILHLCYSAAGPADGTGPKRIRDLFHDGQLAFWNARQIRVGDSARIHWEGDEIEPAGAVTVSITKIEDVVLPVFSSDSAKLVRTRVLEFDRASARDVVAGECPNRPRFQQQGFVYEIED